MLALDPAVEPAVPVAPLAPELMLADVRMYFASSEPDRAPVEGVLLLGLVLPDGLELVMSAFCTHPVSVISF